jgi:integrase
VRAVYSVLRAIFNRGVRLGLVRVNPCTNVDLPRSPREEMLFLTSEQVAQLANAIDPYYRTLVYFAAYTGLRAGELAALQRRDVDLLRGFVHVRRSLKDVGGRLELGTPKTRGSERTISLPAFLREMLSAHLVDPALSPGGTGPEAFVFPGREGGPLRIGLFVRRHFRPAVKSCLPSNLHGLRFHDLRHTCAALSIAAGAHPKLISARLGHSSIVITLDRYGHLFPSVEEALAEKLDAAFNASANAETASSVVSLPAQPG